MGGMRVGLKISGETCPVVQESSRNDAEVKEVNKVSLGRGRRTIEEIVFDDDIDCVNDSFEELFSTGELSVYRYSRQKGENCACDSVERSIEHPISNVRIKNGYLYITVYLDEIEALQPMIETLENEFNSVSVCKIDHSDIKATEDMMTFDRGKLTERQREVYRTAYEMGYFEHTKRANASQIADELGIAVSTFSEHLSIVQAKIADEFFNEGDYY